MLRDKFFWSEEAIDDVLLLLGTRARLVQPTETLDVVSDDPDDNRIIECALAAGSSFIVTGDSDLLGLGSYGNIRMLKVADFLKLVDVASAE